MSYEANKETRRAFLVAVGLLALIAVLPYLNSIRNGFVLDDDFQILARHNLGELTEVPNPYVSSLASIPTFFARPGGAFSSASNLFNYRPLMMSSYAVLYRTFGLSHSAFHFASILLNAAVVILIFVLAVRITHSHIWAWSSALLFALHPIHAEVVDWAAALPDLEVTVFMLLAVGAFLERRPVMVFLASLLAMFSKEQAMMLPTLLTVLALYASGRVGWAALLKRVWVPWAALAAYMIARIAVLAGLVLGTNGRWFYRGTAQFGIGLFGDYVASFFWPFPLTFFHFQNPPEAVRGLWIAALSLLVFLMLLRSRNTAARWASFGLLWFAMTLLPVLNCNLVQGVVVCERYLYLPSVGLCWTVGFALSWLWSKGDLLARSVMALAATAAALFLAFSIVVRNPAWDSDLSILTADVAEAPTPEKTNAYRLTMLQGLGALHNAYWVEGRHCEMVDVSREIVSLSDSLPSELHNSWLQMRVDPARRTLAVASKQGCG